MDKWQESVPQNILNVERRIHYAPKKSDFSCPAFANCRPYVNLKWILRLR